LSHEKLKADCDEQIESLRGQLQRQTGRLVAAQEENSDLRRDLSAAGGKQRTGHSFSGVELPHAREQTGPFRLPKKGSDG
jgi:hypothetical protein